MKVLFRQFLGKNHSWSLVGQNLASTMIDNNHSVQLFSTNGISHFPKHLVKNLVGYLDEKGSLFGNPPSGEFDLEVSYTAPINFPKYLSNSKNSKKFGIWASEFNGNNKSTFPQGFAKNYQYVDKILAPSEFCLQGYLNAGVPKEYLELVPHGINKNFLTNKEVFNLKTDREVRFLLNAGGQLHKRKQVAKTLDAWGKAFTDKDDVVLVAKVSNKVPEQNFEESWKDLIRNFRNKYKNPAPIIVISDFIDDISSLYNATDVVISSGQEGFNLPALEAFYSDNLFIGLNYGGHLDFCNKDNSLLINGKLIPCPQEYQYWQPSPNALLFEPDVLHYAELLQKAAKEKSQLLNKFKPEIDFVKENYTWNKVYEKIINIYNGLK